LLLRKKGTAGREWKNLRGSNKAKQQDLLPIIGLFVCIIALLSLSMDARRQCLSTLFTVHRYPFIVT
jgi:hypothetical protein